MVLLIVCIFHISYALNNSVRVIRIIPKGLFTIYEICTIMRKTQDNGLFEDLKLTKNNRVLVEKLTKKNRKRLI